MHYKFNLVSWLNARCRTVVPPFVGRLHGVTQGASDDLRTSAGEHGTVDGDGEPAVEPGGQGGHARQLGQLVVSGTVVHRPGHAVRPQGRQVERAHSLSRAEGDRPFGGFGRLLDTGHQTGANLSWLAGQATYRTRR